MTIGERIKIRRKEMGLSVDDLAQKLKKNRATIYRYESNDIEKLPANILAPLAEALGVTPAWLMGYGEERAPESQLAPPAATRIPLLGVVAAGIPIEAIENIEDYEEIPAEWGTDRDYFALRVRGDSMEPLICDGDRVIVQKLPCVDSGQIAVILVNGCEATVKQVKLMKDGMMLVGMNPAAYSPCFYTAEEIEKLPIVILGRVVEIRRSV